MMKQFFITVIIFAFCANLYSQEYYYWYKGKKQLLTLVPTKKYLSITSLDDTLALKNRLTKQGVFVNKFLAMPSLTGKYTIYWTIVEGEKLPDFTKDESVIYEGGYFQNVGGLNEEFWVKVPQKEYLPLIVNLATENNVNILGLSDYGGYYVFSCTKQSKKNSMQMANLIYENGWCTVAEMGFVDYGSDANNFNGTGGE